MIASPAKPVMTGPSKDVYSIALIGNPNCGKTTLYNLLTGTHQRVGNWPGVTVERREGWARLGPSLRAKIIDLPGVYSLLGGGGEDQTVARQFLREGKMDLVVQVLDASNLERHLLLTAELLTLGCPLLLVLNMMDDAEAAGLVIDPRVLAGQLGVPVIAMVARKGKGLRELQGALREALDNPPQSASVPWEPPVAAALQSLGNQITAPGSAFLALEYLELPGHCPAELRVARAEQAKILVDRYGETAEDLLPAQRFAFAARIFATVTKGRPQGSRQAMIRALDRWVLHPWLGVPIFLGVLYLTFVVSFSGGNVFLDFFDQASAALLVHGLGHLLLQWGGPDWLVTAIAGGLGGGLHLVISFIPPIGLTFLFLALLEDSGYMARAAYVMDRLTRRVGLPGNSLLPMVIGFGCNVPAIMGSRIIDDPRGRILTVLMQPFMSCSARLTIYMAFAVVFFRHWGGQLVFLLYVVGIVAALFTAWLLGRTALPGQARAFVLELPPYRLPNVRSVFLQAWQRLQVFVLRVGKVIAALGFLLFILPGLGWTQQGLESTDLDHSLLAQGSRALAPLFSPMGISENNWPAVAGLVAGAAAKEVVIGTLNGIYQRQEHSDLLADYRHPHIGAELLAALETIPANAKTFLTSLADPLGLRALEDPQQAIASSGASSQTLAGLAQGFTPLSALAYLLFVLLYVPCASTMGALRREVGWGWMGFSIAYGVGMAYGVATLVYQWGTFSQDPKTTLLWTALVAIAIGLLVLGLRWHGHRTQAPLLQADHG